MPGPCATKPYKKRDANPNKKSAARLARRQAEFTGKNSQNGQQQHMPGSQNRKK